MIKIDDESIGLLEKKGDQRSDIPDEKIEDINQHMKSAFNCTCHIFSQYYTGYFYQFREFLHESVCLIEKDVCIHMYATFRQPSDYQINMKE